MRRSTEGMQPPMATARFDLFSSLRHRNSRIFWSGTGIASIAQAAFLVSSGWLAFQLHGSGGTGLVTFATTVPFLLATPIGGVLADRFDRRTLVLVTQSTQCAIALTLGTLTVLGILPFPLFVGLIFVSGIARTTELPTVSSMLPSLVPRDEILNVYALNSLATLGSRFVGPATVAAVLATKGAGVAYLGIAALYIPAFLLVSRIPRKVAGGVVNKVTLGQQITEGGRYIAKRGIVALILGMIILHCLLTMSFDSILPLFAEQNLRGSGAIYSSLVSAMGLGAIAGSLTIAGLRNRRARGAMFLAGGVGSGIFTVLMTRTDGIVPTLLVLFVVGASQTMFMTLANSMVQEAVPDSIRGRVGSLFLMSGGGIMSLGNLANGYLAGRVGTSPVLALPGITFLVLLAVISATRPQLRGLFQRGELPPDRDTQPPPPPVVALAAD